MNILILYATFEGQTAKIAEHMAGILRNKGHQVTTQSDEQLPADFSIEKFDAAILGGSIHMGHYAKHFKKFVEQHRDWLNSNPTAFFTVCMAIHSKIPESQQEAAAFGDNFMNKTAWQASMAATFAGAVKYTQYNFVTRFIMKRISKKEGGSTDTSTDHEYTDWEAVGHFAEQFAEKLNELQEA